MEQILGKYAARKAMSTCLIDMEKKVITLETEKRLLAKRYAEMLSFTIRKGVKNARTGDNFIDTVPLVYLEFALHIEKAIRQYCCGNVFELVPFTSELQRSYQMSDESVQ